MVSKNLKIEIRPVPNRGGIKQFSENLEYFSQAHIIAPFVNPVTRKYETGLSEEDKAYLKEQNFPYDLSDNYLKGEAHPFWESSALKVELKSNPIFLFPGQSLIDFVKYKYLLVNSYIYKSEQEMLSGSKPEATHYIYDESEALSIKASSLEKRNALINQIGKLSAKRKRDIILILLEEDTSTKGDDFLTVRFEEILNNTKLRERLIELLDKDVATVSLNALIKMAISKGVLARNKKGIFYFETNLGFAEEDVIKFLSKVENQEIYLTIKSKI